VNLVRYVLDYIMHSDDTQVHHSLASLVHNPRRDLHHAFYNTRSKYPRRNHMNDRCSLYSRDRNRRT